MSRFKLVEIVWTNRKTALVGLIVGMTSILLTLAVGKCRDIWDGDLPDVIFGLLHFGVFIIYPIAALSTNYTRIITAKKALVYALCFGVGWSITMESYQILTYGIWKGIRTDERTVLNWIIARGTTYGLVEIVSVAVLMISWALCRLLQGRIIMQDGSLCPNCTYNLTGNVSGVCPECGVEIPSHP